MKLKQRLKRDDALDPDWWCWQFDRAVRWLGLHIDNELGKCKSERDAQNKLDYLLGEPAAMHDRAITTLVSALGIADDLELPF